MIVVTPGPIQLDSSTPQWQAEEIFIVQGEFSSDGAEYPE